MKRVTEYYRIYKEVNRLAELQNRRHPMFYKKMAMKVFIVLMNLFILGYLFFIGFTLKDVLQSVRPGMEPYNLFNEGMVVLLMFDMFFRFMSQDTPAIKIRPFLLLPVSRKIIMDCYLIRILLMPANLLWFALLMPFAAKSVFPFYGFTGCIGYILGWWLIISLNSYFYLLCRTLIMKCWLWILLPIIMYISIMILIFLPETECVAYFFMYLGEGWMKGHAWTYLIVIACIALLFLLNRNIQWKAVYAETSGNPVSKQTISPIRKDFSIFNRLGITGEFIKMEIKSTLRNKTIRSQFLTFFILSIFFGLILAFVPETYGEKGNAFWCYYCFFAQTTPLLHTLSTEGNYMDGLMVRKKLLNDLLKGKYLFFCMLEFVPLLIMIFPVVTHTISVWRWISCYLVTIGFCMPIMLHTAVYTNYATPMNKKLTQGNSNDNVGLTFLWMGIVLGLPIGIQFLLSYYFSETISYIIICLIGITGFLTYPYWTTSLYKRIYSRRYVNMQGFRSSRQI